MPEPKGGLLQQIGSRRTIRNLTAAGAIALASTAGVAERWNELASRHEPAKRAQTSGQYGDEYRVVVVASDYELKPHEQADLHQNLDGILQSPNVTPENAVRKTDRLGPRPAHPGDNAGDRHHDGRRRPVAGRAGNAGTGPESGRVGSLFQQRLPCKTGNSPRSGLRLPGVRERRSQPQVGTAGTGTRAAARNLAPAGLRAERVGSGRREAVYRNAAVQRGAGRHGDAALCRGRAASRRGRGEIESATARASTGSSTGNTGRICRPCRTNGAVHGKARGQLPVERDPGRSLPQPGSGRKTRSGRTWPTNGRRPTCRAAPVTTARGSSSRVTRARRDANRSWRRRWTSSQPAGRTSERRTRNAGAARTGIGRPRKRKDARPAREGPSAAGVPEAAGRPTRPQRPEQPATGPSPPRPPRDPSVAMEKFIRERGRRPAPIRYRDAQTPQPSAGGTKAAGIAKRLWQRGAELIREAKYSGSNAHWRKKLDALKQPRQTKTAEPDDRSAAARAAPAAGGRTRPARRPPPMAAPQGGRTPAGAKTGDRHASCRAWNGQGTSAVARGETSP